MVPLSGAAVKNFVKRERTRRAALNLPPNAQHARGQGKLTIDEEGIFLLPPEAASASSGNYCSGESGLRLIV